MPETTLPAVCKSCTQAIDTMSETIDIGKSAPADRAAIEGLYPAAFPEEDLLPLVRALSGDPDLILSLVARIGPEVVGHVAFTRCRLEEGDGADSGLLGPLVVAPNRQGHGIGSALVREGLARLADARVERIYVLGAPGYYGRFGFRPERRVQPPFAFPSDLPPEWADAWQALDLVESEAPATGVLAVPGPWRERKWWLP